MTTAFRVPFPIPLARCATAIGAVAAFVAACGGPETTSPPPAVCTLTAVAVTPSTPSVAVGDNAQISAAVSQKNCTTNVVSWSSGATNIATVNGTGASATIQGIGPGTATITATATTEKGTMTGTATVTVTPAGVATVSIDAPSKTSIIVNEQLTLTATTKDSHNATLSGRAITWSSASPAVATIDPNSGRVTGVAAGTTNITATSEGKTSGALAITVTGQTVSTIDVAPQSAVIEVSGTTQFKATAKDVNGNTIANQTFTWTSSNPAATVDDKGNVTGVSVSTAEVTIRAAAGGKSGSAAINVTAATARSIDLTPSTAPAVLVAQDTLQVTAVVRDAKGNAITRPVTWKSSNASVATVSSTGVVIAVATGSVTITAASDNATKDLALTITKTANNQRFGYALAVGGSKTGEYVADSAFNGAGGDVRVTRTGVGLYSLKFLRMQGDGLSEDMFVNTVNSTTANCVGHGIFVPGNTKRDLEADVMCTNASGAAVDAQFNVMVVGQESLPGTFAEVYTDDGFNTYFYNWNSSGQPFSVSPGTGSGVAAVKYGLPIATSDAYLAFATTTGTPDICRPAGRVGDIVSFQCLTRAGAASTKGFYSMLIGGGRTGKRFGMVYNDQPTQASYVPSNAFSKNTAGGLNQIAQTATGSHTVTFKLLGGTAPMGVLVNPGAAPDLSVRLCSIVSTSTTGSDFAVKVSCTQNGAAANVPFQLIVIE